MNHYITPEGNCYFSNYPISADDIQVPIAPGPNYIYNFEKSVWEEQIEPEQSFEKDLTIGEAEQLYTEAQNGSMAAQLLIRWENL